MEGTVIADLTAELEALERQEQEWLRQEEEIQLRRRISNKQKAIEDLRQASFKNLPTDDYTSWLMVKDLPKVDSRCPESRTSLDDLLASWDVAPSQPALSTENGPNRPGFPTPQSMWSLEAPPLMTLQQLECFSSQRLAKGEKPILIVGFVNNIVPQEEEETLGSQGNAKIVVSYGPKKPKFESISIPQWVVANTRIFNTLLLEGKLPTPSAIQ